MSKRLFIAYKLPVDLRNDLLIVQHKIKNNLQTSGVNWVKPENMHITIAFLGQVEEKNISSIEDILRRVDFRNTAVKGDKFSFFMRNNAPAILYFALSNIDNLSDTANKIRGKLVDNSIDFDRKIFNPHITFARIKEEESGNSLKEYLQTKGEQMQGSQYLIGSIVLYESRFSDNGPFYVTLFEKNQEV